MSCAIDVLSVVCDSAITQSARVKADGYGLSRIVWFAHESCSVKGELGGRVIISESDDSRLLLSNQEVWVSHRVVGVGEHV